MAFSLLAPRRIALSHPCSLTPAQAKAKIEAVASSLCPDAGIGWVWLAPTRLRFSGTGVSTGVGGFITLTGKSLEITLTLPGHLACLEGKIRASIEAALLAHLPPSAIA